MRLRVGLHSKVTERKLRGLASRLCGARVGRMNIAGRLAWQYDISCIFWTLVSVGMNKIGNDYRHLLGDYIPSTIIAHIPRIEYPYCFL